MVLRATHRVHQSGMQRVGRWTGPHWGRRPEWFVGALSRHLSRADVRIRLSWAMTFTEKNTQNPKSIYLITNNENQDNKLRTNSTHKPNTCQTKCLAFFIQRKLTVLFQSCSYKFKDFNPNPSDKIHPSDIFCCAIKVVRFRCECQLFAIVLSSLAGPGSCNSF